MKSVNGKSSIMTGLCRLVACASLLVIVLAFDTTQAEAAVMYSEPPDLPGQYSRPDPPPDPLFIGTLALGENLIQGRITVSAEFDFADRWTATLPGELQVTGAAIRIIQLDSAPIVSFLADIYSDGAAVVLGAEGTQPGTYQLLDAFGLAPVVPGPATISGSVHTAVTGNLPANEPRVFDYELTVTTAPIPEPSTYALMLAGIATVGAFARRRRRR